MLGWRVFAHMGHLGSAVTGMMFWWIYSNQLQSCDTAFVDANESYSNNRKLTFLEANKIDEKCILPVNRSSVFYGNHEKLKPNGKYAIFYSRNRTYFGEILNSKFTFNGRGCLRNEKTGQVFYGFFKNGRV